MPVPRTEKKKKKKKKKEEEEKDQAARLADSLFLISGCLFLEPTRHVRARMIIINNVKILYDSRLRNWCKILK
jgi:hypothetical protein